MTNPEYKDLAQAMLQASKKSSEMTAEFMINHPDWFAPKTGSNAAQWMDPLGVFDTFAHALGEIKHDPATLLQAQARWWQDSLELWQNTTRRMLGEEVKTVARPGKGDNRFRDEDWDENPVFDFIKQSYLLTSRFVENTVADADGLDEKTRHKLEFYTRQFLDAISPTNFALTNPRVMRETVESKGENLVNGFKNILNDLERGEGKLKVSMTDTKAFEMGKDVAASPGDVIYQNDLIQLIQYQATTKQVFKRPVLILPPWINKYYILDLRPKNSLIKWLVEQGHSVFVVSWVNPDERHAKKGFDSYMLEGPMAAMDVIAQATGEKEVNAIGYCLGGTLLAATLAYMQAQNDTRIKSATFLTTMIDFAEPGDLGVFVDAKQIENLETQMAEKGYLDGSEMATTFNMLRANDLIWSFVINNYLLGKEPMAFDLLYWNSDATRMPAKMHSFYLREMYLKNNFQKPNGITLAGTPIDLSKIKVPCYFLSTREDHIAPWRSTFSGAKLMSGPVRFVLSGSGHIAGVVNPPVANKYSYWTNRKKPSTAGRAEVWLDSATPKDGSWWPDWQKWVNKYTDGKVKARGVGGKKLKPIEAAPGSYAKLRLE